MQLNSVGGGGATQTRWTEPVLVRIHAAVLCTSWPGQLQTRRGFLLGRVPEPARPCGIFPKHFLENPEGEQAPFEIAANPQGPCGTHLVFKAARFQGPTLLGGLR